MVAEVSPELIFDPAVIKDPLYFREPGKGYVKVTKAVHTKILAGGFKL